MVYHGWTVAPRAASKAVTAVAVASTSIPRLPSVTVQRRSPSTSVSVWLAKLCAANAAVASSSVWPPSGIPATLTPAGTLGVGEPLSSSAASPIALSRTIRPPASMPAASSQGIQRRLGRAARRGAGAG